MNITRRTFLGNTLATTAAGSLLGAGSSRAEEKPAPAEKPAEFKRKIKVGCIGLGGRGNWIAELLKSHGGFEVHAVADYFPSVADRQGNALGVDKSRRFSGLSGYKKVIESGVEALVIEDVPYFYPEQAKTAMDAGLHIFMAKPVCVDAPGALSIAETGKLATRKQRVFLVDYQIPTDPINIEVAQRIRDGGLGKLAQVQTFGIQVSRFSEPPRAATIENRLQQLSWVNDIALGCDFIGNYDIHAIDAAVWVLGRRPVSASGSSRICRSGAFGDSHDSCSVVYEYSDGLVHNHFGESLNNNNSEMLDAVFYGTDANARISYWGKSFVRGGSKHFGGGVANLYATGAQTNIATFYNNITEGKFDNSTVVRAVDGVLTCILGREAAARRGKLTMEELLMENKKLEVDLSGLKA